MVEVAILMTFETRKIGKKYRKGRYLPFLVNNIQECDKLITFLKQSFTKENYLLLLSSVRLVYHVCKFAVVTVFG